MDCLFCKIAEGSIPADKMYEDADMVIIRDINPQSKIHLLLIPKTHYANMGEFASKNSALLARCMETLASKISEFGLDGGYRLVTNKGSDGRQSVDHIHIHILGGNKLSGKMG